MAWNRLKNSFSELKENDQTTSSTHHRTKHRKTILTEKRLTNDNSLSSQINCKKRKLLTKNYSKLNLSLNYSQKSSILNDSLNDKVLLQLCTGTLGDYHLNSTSTGCNAQNSADLLISFELQSSPNKNTQLQKLQPDENSGSSILNSFKPTNYERLLYDEKLRLDSFSEEIKSVESPLTNETNSPLKIVNIESDDNSSVDITTESQNSNENREPTLLIEDYGSEQSTGTESSVDFLKVFNSDNFIIDENSERINEIMGNQASTKTNLDLNSINSNYLLNDHQTSKDIECYSSASLHSSNSSNKTFIDLFPTSTVNNDNKKDCTELDLLIFDIQKDFNKKATSKFRVKKGGHLEHFRKIQKSNQSNKIFWNNEVDHGLIQPCNTFKILSIKQNYNINIALIENNNKMKKEIILDLANSQFKDLKIGSYINVEFDFDSYEINNSEYILGVNKIIKQYENRFFIEIK